MGKPAIAAKIASVLKQVVNKSSLGITLSGFSGCNLFAGSDDRLVASAWSALPLQ